MTDLPRTLQTLLSRFDRREFDMPAGRARVRLTVTEEGSWDFEVKGDRERVRAARKDVRPDAEMTATQATWSRVAADLPGGMAAFHSGRLRLRHNLHLGVNFLAATSGSKDPDRLRFRTIETSRGRVSTMEAGSGRPVLMLHGLGATKAEFIPTLAALAPAGMRMIAIDLPGFGDTDKPFPAPYNAPFFADWVLSTLDALGIEQVDLVGHSMGGRVALEVAMREPGRVRSLVLMTPSMAWLADRRWAAPLKLVRPELGIFQPTPRPVVETIVKRVVPGASSHVVAPAIDEFLRAYMTRRGRVAFYAAARQIYLEDPKGFWSRLPELAPKSLFIWGRHDTLVPIGFERHVRDALPAAEHVELDCGHVPQLECPELLHGAIGRFLEVPAADRPAAPRPAAAAASTRRAVSG